MSDKWVGRVAEDSASRRIAELERENATLRKENAELKMYMEKGWSFKECPSCGEAFLSEVYDENPLK